MDRPTNYVNLIDNYSQQKIISFIIMITASIYSLQTGFFTGVQFSIHQIDIEKNLPQGFSWIEGRHDHKSFKVNLDTGLVVDWQPPAPADDDLRTWSWHADLRAWQPKPTLAALALTMRAERTKRLGASDWVVSRAAEFCQPVPALWAAYRQALRDLPQQPEFPADPQWPQPPIE